MAINISFKAFLPLPSFITKKIKINKSTTFACVGEATTGRPLTGAIPLLLDTGAFGCWVSPLARFTPP